jgi:hypothetical protein
MTGKYMARLGRPPGPSSTTKDVSFYDSQLDHLEALRAIAPIAPSFAGQVRQAVTEYIDREEAKLGIRERVEAYLKKNRKVVGLHEVKNRRENHED